MGHSYLPEVGTQVLLYTPKNLGSEGPGSSQSDGLSSLKPSRSLEPPITIPGHCPQAFSLWDPKHLTQVLVTLVPGLEPYRERFPDGPATFRV